MLLGRNPANLDSEKEASFEDFGFAALSESPHGFTNVPRRLIPRHHELCEACLNGDNEIIQALCLPPEAAENDETPLQITVVSHDARGIQVTGLLASFSSCVGIDFGLGLRQFSIAIERRKWDTARLILAIAVAQYKADDKEVVFSVDDMDIGKSAAFNASAIHNACSIDDDGSDNESDCSFDSDASVEQKNKENLYVYVAKRPSTVKCEVKSSVHSSLHFADTVTWLMVTVG